MYGATRATLTLLGVALAGFLFWLGAQVLDPFNEQHQTTSGEFWTWQATLAAAGFIIALSQLLGGWTKWGWPRISVPVFAVAFLPGLVAGVWVLFFHDPGHGWLPRHIRDWTDDIGIGSFVADLGVAQAAIGVLLGLVFGLTFDTAGPRVRRASVARGEPVASGPAARETPAETPPDSREEPPRAPDGTIEPEGAGESVTPARDRPEPPPAR